MWWRGMSRGALVCACGDSCAFICMLVEWHARGCLLVWLTFLVVRITYILVVVRCIACLLHTFWLSSAALAACMQIGNYLS